MRQVFAAAVCAVLLSGCATAYTMTPLASSDATLIGDAAAAVSDKAQGSVQVRSAEVADKLWFEVSVRNKAAAPAVFGYDNLVALDAKAKPLRLFSRADLSDEAYKNADRSRQTVDRQAALAAAAAREAATSTREKTIEGPKGVVKIVEKTYDAALATSLRQEAFARADADATSIDRLLDVRLARLNDGRMLQTVILMQGAARTAQVVVAPPSSYGPKNPVTLQVTLNGETHSFLFAVEPVR